MTLLKFKSLHDDDKIAILHKHGCYIGKRKIASIHVLLFQLEGFYIQIFYREYRKVIHHIHCFESAAFIDPYLDDIEINHLVYT